MKYLLIIFLALIKNTYSIEAERYGFEIELDRKQLEEIVEYFDFSLKNTSRSRVLNSLDMKDFDDYLLDVKSFHSLPEELKQEIMNNIPKTTAVKEAIKQLYATRPNYNSRDFKVGLRKISEYWNKNISTNMKRDCVHFDLLSKRTKAKLFLELYEHIPLKSDLSIPPHIKDLFSHLEYFRDLSSLEFRYLYSHIVTDKTTFLSDLRNLCAFFKVEKLLDNPLSSKSESLSLHIHLSGEEITDDFLRLWNSKMLLNQIRAIPGIEAFGLYGHRNNISTKGFVRKVEEKHGELRNLTTTPEKALSLSKEQLKAEIFSHLSSKSETNLKVLRDIAEFSPNAISSLFSHFSSWPDDLKYTWKNIISDKKLEPLDHTKIMQRAFKDFTWSKDQIEGVEYLLSKFPDEELIFVLESIAALDDPKPYHFEKWNELLNSDKLLDQDVYEVAKFFQEKVHFNESTFKLWKIYLNSPYIDSSALNTISSIITHSNNKDPHFKSLLLEIINHPKFDIFTVEEIERFLNRQVQWNDQLEKITLSFEDLVFKKFQYKVKIDRTKMCSPHTLVRNLTLK